MRSLRRAAAILPLLVVGAAAVHFGSAQADDTNTASNMVLGSDGGTQPQTMEEFLTAVTKDVDTYWTKVFKENGLDEPRVKYAWIPAGQTAASACGDEDGELGDSAAAYCQADDTIYISQELARTSSTARSTRNSPAARRATARPPATSRWPTSSLTSTAT